MNRKYYIVLPYQRKGPYNVEELKQFDITPETLIWAFEFNEPQKAKDIPDLKVLLEQTKVSKEDTPPPPPTSENNEIEETKKTVEEEIDIPEAEETKKEKEIIEQKIVEEEKEIEENKLEKQIESKETIEQEKDIQETEEINKGKNVIEENKLGKEAETEKKEEKLEDNVPSTPTMISYKKEDYTEQETYKKTHNDHHWGEKPKDYIVWSILSLFFCWNIVAIASLITGIITNNQYKAGDYETAKKMSKTTLIILLVSWGLTIFSFIIIVIAASQN